MEKNKLHEVAIVVFTKTPDVPVKTRIAQAAGEEIAESIYRELLTVTAVSLEGVTYHVSFGGNTDPGELRTYFPDARSFVIQHGNDLGSRMKNVCLHFMNSGYNSCIVMGCDCPDRSTSDIIAAAEHLVNGNDIVLGPVEDGGYHLAGANRAGLCIFDATQWGTPYLLDETLSIAKKQGLNVARLRRLSDIDTIDDYTKWKDRFS
jgi:uncharacterized protein